jgi:hypothetical protein
MTVLLLLPLPLQHCQHQQGLENVAVATVLFASPISLLLRLTCHAVAALTTCVWYNF